MTFHLLSFQTFDEITLQIEQGDLTQEQQHELWECLYLRTNEIDELLRHVRENALHTFHYPMFVAAAHTGARRSELMRSQLADIRDDVLIIREKKRRRGQESTRRVPMSALLKETLRDWQREHPGGPHTFTIVDSSSRQRPDSAQALTRDEAHNHFQCILKDSRWNVIRGGTVCGIRLSAISHRIPSTSGSLTNSWDTPPKKCVGGIAISFRT